MKYNNFYSCLGLLIETAKEARELKSFPLTEEQELAILNAAINNKSMRSYIRTLPTTKWGLWQCIIGEDRAAIEFSVFKNKSIWAEFENKFEGYAPCEDSHFAFALYIPDKKAFHLKFFNENDLSYAYILGRLMCKSI